AKTRIESEFRKGSHRGARPPPEKPAIYFTPSCSRARITASAPRMVSLPFRSSQLEPHRVAITTRIGRPHQHTTLRITDDHLGFAVVDARPTPRHPVPQRFQSTHRLFRHLCLDAQLHLPIYGGRVSARETPPARCFHRRLRVHSKINEVGKHLEIALR